jgi:RND superfamily putative drug exporter
VMRLLGQWNWWAPHPLRVLHRRAGLGEFGTLPVEDPTV